MYEVIIKEKILRMLKKTYPFVWFYKTSDKWIKGIPDILMCVDGHLWAMEIKRPGYDAEPIQQAIIDRINRAGGRAAVVHSVDEAKSFMKGGE